MKYQAFHLLWEAWSSHPVSVSSYRDQLHIHNSRFSHSVMRFRLSDQPYKGIIQNSVHLRSLRVIHQMSSTFKIIIEIRQTAELLFSFNKSISFFFIDCLLRFSTLDIWLHQNFRLRLSWQALDPGFSIWRQFGHTCEHRFGLGRNEKKTPHHRL